MKTHKLTIFFALVAMAALAWAGHEHHLAQRAEDESARANLASAAAARKLARTGPIGAAPRVAPRPAPAAGPGQPGPRGGDRASLFGGFLKTFGDPRIQRITSLQARIRLDSQYGDLFRALNLAPQQLDQFKNLLVEKEMVAFDSMSAAQEQGIDMKSDPKGFFMAVAAGQKSVDEQISDLLGGGNYSQFQQYEQTIPARNTANLLQQSLAYTATPLTPEQSSGLVQILAQSATPPLPPGNPFAVLNGDLGVIKLGDQATGQVQGLLSAPQLAALQADVRAQRQLYQARRQTAQ